MRKQQSGGILEMILIGINKMKRKIKSISSEEFFKLLASNAGVDLITARNTYYGMLRTITRELKGRRILNLPDWGKFFILMYKEREIVDYKTKQKKKIPTTPVLKFVPDYKLKQYFKELRDNQTMV